MRDFVNLFKLMCAYVGACLGWLIGGCDGLLYALAAFMAVDYMTGVICAVCEKKLSSEIGFRGLFKKIVIFMFVIVGHMLDMNVFGGGAVVRSAVIFFYLANEGISLTENAARLGLPIPQKLKDVFEQLKKDGDGDE